MLNFLSILRFQEPKSRVNIRKISGEMDFSEWNIQAFVFATEVLPTTRSKKITKNFIMRNLISPFKRIISFGFLPKKSCLLLSMRWLFLGVFEYCVPHCHTKDWKIVNLPRCEILREKINLDESNRERVFHRRRHVWYTVQSTNCDWWKKKKNWKCLNEFQLKELN